MPAGGRCRWRLNPPGKPHISGGRLSFNRSEKNRLLGFVICVLAALASIAGLWRGLDGAVYQTGMNLAPERTTSDSVLLVTVDDDALRRHDDWSALADAMGQAVARVRQAGARVTALVLPPDWGLAGPAADARLSSRISGDSPLLLGLPYRQWRTDSERSDLGSNWIPDYHRSSAIPSQSEPELTGRLQHWLSAARTTPNGRLLPVHPGLSSRVDGVGFLPADRGVATTREPAAILRSGDHNYPSLAFHVAVRMADSRPEDVRVQLPSDLHFARQRIATDTGYHFLPHFHDGDGERGIRRTDLSSLLSDRFSPEMVRGRAVIIGTTSEQWAATLATPVGRLSPVEIVAQHAHALITGELYTAPDWVAILPWVVLFVVGLYLCYLLPQVGFATGVALTLLLAVILVNVQLVLPMARMIRIDLAMPVMALLSGHLALGLRRYLMDRRQQVRNELSEANRLLGEAWQAQGKLDTAYERLKLCEPGPRLMDQLYDLALDFERRRQFAKAQSVLKRIAGYSPGFADVDARIRKLAALESKMALGPGGAGARSLILTEDGMQRPMLGRYEIEKELGRGAMGVVYLGKDPRIGRTVAVKTVALSEEFEGEQLEKVTDRFFREAETAGRLNHPSIVTIYDVGEEADLAYIAMDYLDGTSLQRYTKPGKLLPVVTVFDIIAQVADALNYAHGHRVVHRDVKPGNMIYDRRTRRIKVTDFGVACLTDASKTKTGTILGTPSYMSPEQVLGRRVDGRSDLFSLGVTFYQMLRGELPFDGQPLATLMYKIANEPHPQVTHLRLDLPPCLNEIMDKALAKKPEDRFQSGAEMAQAVRKCRSHAVAIARKQKERSQTTGAVRGKA